MGEAKRRGTREERVAQAIEAGGTQEVPLDMVPESVKKYATFARGVAIPRVNIRRVGRKQKAPSPTGGGMVSR